MADDLENRGKAEDARINTSHQNEIIYWTKPFC